MPTFARPSDKDLRFARRDPHPRIPFADDTTTDTVANRSLAVIGVVVVVLFVLGVI